MPDSLFADARLAGLYDPLEGDRPDLDVYSALVEELGAVSVLDVGCGTGTFACALACHGIDVVGVDPAQASLDIARTKPGADRVRWVLGDATSLPPLAVDLATMTGNVAQVFLADDDLHTALSGIRAAVRPRGAVVFEVRDPVRQGWRQWTRDQTERRTELEGIGRLTWWVDLVEVSLPFVSFRSTFRFDDTDEVLVSESTLRFRSAAEVEHDVARSGLTVVDIRDAPDRPGLELVFVCVRSDEP